MSEIRDISNGFVVTTAIDGEDAVAYIIETTRDNLIIPTGSSSATWSGVITFYKKEGDDAPAVYSFYSGLAKRKTDGTYEWIQQPSSNKVNHWGTVGTPYTFSVGTDYTSILILCWEERPDTTSIASLSCVENYTVKKELPVVRDGRNAVRIDLDNQADMIACDAEGKVRFQRTVTTTARIFDGATPVTSGVTTSSATITVIRNGISTTLTSSPTYGSGGAMHSWTLNAGDVLPYLSTQIDIVLTYPSSNGTSYRATFTLTRVDSSAIYQLLPSRNEIAFGVDADNNYTPSEIGIYCGYTKDTGSMVEKVESSTGAIDSKYQIWYRYINADGRPETSGINGEGWMPLGRTAANPMMIPSSVSYIAIDFALMNYTGSVQADKPTSENAIDIETVPILKSGKKGAPGTNGADGSNAIRVDLDNEHEDFIYDDAGNNRSGSVTSQARLYDGTRLVNARDVTWSVSERSGTTSALSGIDSNGLLTVSGITASTAKVTIRAEYRGEYYYASFTANKTNQDKYELVLRPNSVAYNQSSYSTKRVTFSVTRIDLSGTRTSPSINTSASAGLRMYAKKSSDANFSLVSNAYYDITPEIAGANTDILFELRLYSGSGDSSYRLCDYDTIPVTKAQNAIRIDLSNETDAIACDANGKVRFQRTVSTSVRLYDGASPVKTGLSITAANIKLAGITPTVSAIDSTTGEIAVSWVIPTSQTLTDASYSVIIPLTYRDVTYTATFSLTRLISDASYQLAPSRNEIAFTINESNQYLPTTGIRITCGYTKYTGGSAETTEGPVTSQIASLYYILFRILDASGNPYPTFGGSQLDGWDWLAGTSSGMGDGKISKGDGIISILGDTTCSAIEFCLSTEQPRVTQNANIIDRETIPILKDGLNGNDGANGRNAIRVDLDNEMDSMLYDGAGNRLSGNIVSHAHLYDGDEDMTAYAYWYLSASGCTIQQDTGSTITVTDVSSTDATVTVTGRYDGNDYTAVMSVKKIVNADKYDLDVSPNSLFMNTTDGWTGNKTITIRVMRTPAGGGTPTAVNPFTYGLSLSVSTGTLSSYDSTNDRFTLTIQPSQASSNDNVVITLYKTSVTNVYDRETVPINKAENGEDGRDGSDGRQGHNAPYEERQYRNYDSKSTDASGVPNGSAQGSWGSSIPAYSVYYPYLWFRARQHTFNASNVETIGDWSYGLMTQPGANGQQGATGKWYEYAGVWGVDIGTQQKGYPVNTETLGKYVKYGDNFYMNVYTDGEENTHTPSNDGTYWSQMTGEREYYMAKAFFGDYAQFGSFIINGNWLISRQGTRNGISSNEYTYFDNLLGPSAEAILYDNIEVTYDRTTLSRFALKRGVTYTFTLTVSSSSAKSEYKLFNSSDTLQHTETFSVGTTSLTRSFNITPSSAEEYYFTVEKWSRNDDVLVTIKVGCSSAFIPNCAIDGSTGRTFQNTAVVRGDVQAITVISSNEQMETVIEAGNVEIRSKSTQSYGVFRINSLGEIVLSMYDKNGNKVIDLGGTPETQINGEWVTWMLYARATGHVSDGKTYYVVTESQCTVYYQLKLGQVLNSGTTLQYFLPPIDGAAVGLETFDSNVIARNNWLFTSKATGANKAALENSIKGLTGISDGFYVKPNNGRFNVDANQYGPTNYNVDIYHFVGGKLEEIITQRFDL